MEKLRSPFLECAEPPPSPTRPLSTEFEGRKSSLPRERLATFGPQALSDAELLAILLGTGTHGHNVLAVAGEILRTHGDDLSLLARATERDLTRIAGVGRVKALELVAVFELCRRILRSTSRAGRPLLDTDERVARFLWPLVALRDTEAFFVLPLDSKSRLCASVRRSDLCTGSGTADATPVHPRDVFREAVKADASFVVVAHNHPSGDPAPSAQDIALTRRLAEAGAAVGIPLLDSLVIGGLAGDCSADPFGGPGALPRFVSIRRMRGDVFPR
ncbi:MAG: DNA repair protein RadC [Kiritimatiellae bacterium]|nr:DNA repair protein RadC [Kiritimatiellia bacterium]